MRLRTGAARWFELLTAREDLTVAVETIARTGSVELETHSEFATRPVLPDLHGRFDEYTRLAQRYHIYWPAPEELRPSELPGQPSKALDSALNHLYAWRDNADPITLRLEALVAEEGELRLLGEFLDNLPDSRLQPELLAQAGPAVRVSLVVLPRDARITRLPPGVIYILVHSPSHLFGLFLGPAAEVLSLEQELAIMKGRRLELPAWLGTDIRTSRMALDRHHREIGRERAALGERLGVLNRSHQLHEALGDIARLEWFLTHVESIPVTENFAWVTGWTSDLSGEDLNTALEESGVRAMVRYPNAPAEKSPPMVFRNPAWARPFEVFARLLGTPSADEADPSPLLVFIVPMLFGYMFGDVGQGALLLIAGLALASRQPELQLLIPAGLMSMVFGFLFGSVFTRDDLLPALWFRPMDEPVAVLVIPLIFGAFLLLLGLVLNGIEAHWRGLAKLWWSREAGMLLAYIGLVSAFAYPPAAGLLLAGLLWFVSGSVAWARSNNVLRSLGSDLARLVEDTVQLAINTLSFTRVGAFALAHAGLSLAVVSLAQSSGSMVVAATVMLLGNALIIALEGLVVSIQITRLVLFEFFIRFLRGEGRTFRPLTAPPGKGGSQKNRK